MTVIRLNVTGANAIDAELRRLQTAAPEALARALFEEALAVDAVSVEKTPVDIGTLRKSHYVSPPVKEAGGFTVELGNGTDYAVYVHENLDARHDDGEAKFLEKALAERTQGYAQRLAKRTQMNVEAGLGIKALPPGPPTRPQE